MRWTRSYNQDPQTTGIYKRAMLIILSGNLILGGLKVFAALWSNSAAIYADAVNSLSDVIYSILLIVGLWVAQRPPDHSHPQGHGRFEPVTALIVTLSMALAGFEAGRSSILRFFSGGEELIIGIPLLILIVSIAIKALMYFLIYKAARETSSPGLDAAASDNVSDVVTSIAAILGIIGAQYINPLIDPIAGIFVSIWILKAVFDLTRENLGYLTGAGAGPDLLDRFIQSAIAIDGVQDVHHVITDYAGPKLVVDMHVNVDGNISLNQAHEICDRTTAVLTAFPEVDRAYVHLEPLGYK